MSKQTITIDIDVRDGYELKYNPETRAIKEVKKEPIRSKSWEEFCKNHPDAESDFIIYGFPHQKWLVNFLNVLKI